MWLIVQLFCLVKLSTGRSSFYEGDIAIDVPDPEYVAHENAPGCNNEDSITSPEECKTAAGSLGFNDDKIDIGSWAWAPSGCYVGYPDTWTNVFFNTIAVGPTGMNMYKSICRKGQGSSKQHAWITTKEKLWPGGIIPYQIDTSSIEDEQVHLNISLAIKDLTDCSCLKFNEIPPSQVATGDFLLFGAHGDATHDGTGCWSYMGKKGGSQVINIPPPHCTSIELITHEILHATGALHEHNRPDRDNHVQILFDNIKPKMQQNFIKQQWEYDNAEDGVESAGTGYDLDSILHYHSFAHGINSSAPTILSLNTNDTRFGSTGIMSITDEMELNLNYDCPIDLHLVVRYLHETVQTNSVNNEVVKEVNAQKVAITKITEKQEETDTKYDQIAKQISQLEIPEHKSEGSQYQLEYSGSGEDGSPGPAGPPGPLGSPGLDGNPGPIGPPGTRGEMGLTGPQGEQITIDSQGLMAKLGELQFGGQQGRKGEPGDRGERGIPGKGTPGAAGKNGDNGQPGLPGSPGVKGDSGKQCEKDIEDVSQYAESMPQLLTKIKKEFDDRVSKMEQDLEERFTKLEELAKVGTLRSCAEYADFGLKTTGYFMIDPDGAMIGQHAFRVLCNFTSGSTEVLHDAGALTNVDLCHDPGCFEKNVTYQSGQTTAPIPLSQIDALMQLSEYCVQGFYYECTLAPLRHRNVDFAFWTDRHGGKNVYFTGGNKQVHSCDCNFSDDGCFEQDTRSNLCNCDSNLPAPLVDTGTLTDMKALPVMKLSFGGLMYPSQMGAFKLGNLKCFGKTSPEIGSSCSALKLKGVTSSGHYEIKKPGSQSTTLVFCDMTQNGYADVPQIKQTNEQTSSNERRISANEQKISTNGGKISANGQKISANGGKISANGGKISTNGGKMSANERRISANEQKISTNKEKIQRKSSYCAYQNDWHNNKNKQVILYDKLLLDDNNINGASFDIGTGKFTAGIAGVYTVQFNGGQIHKSTSWSTTKIYIRINGVNGVHLYQQMNPGQIEAAGISMLVKMGRGDTLDAYGEYIAYVQYITFCVSLQNE